MRVEAIGVNFAEVLSRKGRYGWAPPIPYTPGMEATGTIELLGPGVEQRAIGERVIVGAQHGAYAEKIVVPARQALPAIADYSIEENAAIAVNYLTAWVALIEMARLRPTDRVLVTAAAGVSAPRPSRSPPASAVPRRGWPGATRSSRRSARLVPSRP